MGNAQSHPSNTNLAIATTTIDTPPLPPQKSPAKSPSTRLPNKLSKPKTNSSSNLLSLSTTSVLNRSATSQNLLEERPTVRRRHSIASIDTAQLAMDRAEKDFKRRERSRSRKALGLFRRQSVQAPLPGPEILATGSTNHADILETEGLEMKYSRHSSILNRELSKKFLRRSTMPAPSEPPVEHVRRHSRQNSVANSIVEESGIDTVPRYSRTNSITEEIAGDPLRRYSRTNSITEEMAGDPMRRYSRHNSMTRETSMTKRFSRHNSITDMDSTSVYMSSSAVPDPELVKRYSRQNSFTQESLGVQQYLSEAASTVPEMVPPSPVRGSAAYVPHLPVHGRLSNIFGSPVTAVPNAQPTQSSPLDFRKSLNSVQSEGSQCLPDRTPEDDRALFVPIRRRSMLQPGLATRAGNPALSEPLTPVVSVHIPEPDKEHSVDRPKPAETPGKSMTSTLGSLVSLAKGKFSDKEKDKEREKDKQKDKDRMRPGARERSVPKDLGLDFPADGTATPSDLEYRHTGGYKFGTLRITNGAASPVSMSEAEDDYFTADRREKKTKDLRGQLPSKDPVKKPWIAANRPESPLRQVLSDEKRKATPPKMDLKVITALAAPQKSNDVFELEGDSSPQRSQELAHEYMQDLPVSPFSFDTSPRVSPEMKMQVTSKHTAMEDNLFEAEDRNSDLIAQSYESGYQAGIAAALAWQAQQAKNSNVDQQAELIGKPLAKADSGYSSNTSLRSSRSNAHTPSSRESPPSPLKDDSTQEILSLPVSNAQATTTTTAVASTKTEQDKTVRPKRSFKSRPVEGELRIETLQELTRRPPPVPRKSADSSTFSLKEFEEAHAQLIPKVPSKRSTIHLGNLVKSPVEMSDKEQSKKSLLKSKSSKKSFRKSLPASLSKESTATKTPTEPEAPSSASKSDHGLKAASKQHPPRHGHSDSQHSQHSQLSQLSQHEIETGHVVQAYPASAVEKINIPPASVHGSKRSSRRVSTQTYVGKKGSRETLGTIFSVGSLEDRQVSGSKLLSDLPPIPSEPKSPVHVADFMSIKTPVSPQYPVILTPPGLVKRHSTETPMLDSAPRRKSMHNLRTEDKTAVAAKTDAPRPPGSPDRSHKRGSSKPRNPYDLFLGDPAEPAYGALNSDQRAKSMTSKLELEAAARFAAARKKMIDEQFQLQSQASPASNVKSNAVSRRQSQELRSPSRPPNHQSKGSGSSISSSKTAPASEPSPATAKRPATRRSRAPPQVHQTRSAYIGLGVPRQTENAAAHSDTSDRTSSITSSIGRVKSPPPVSLVNPRKISHGTIRRELAPTPSLPPTPMLDSQAQMAKLNSVQVPDAAVQSAGIFRNQTAPPSSSTQQQPTQRDLGLETWPTPPTPNRQRRQSSGETLSYEIKAQSSTEYISAIPQSFRQSMTARTEYTRQPTGNKGVYELNGSPGLRSYRSFDTSQMQGHAQVRYPSSRYPSSQFDRSYLESYSPGGYMGDEYDHTYGSAARNGHNSTQERDLEYYESVDDSELQELSVEQSGLPSPRSASTSDMFINPLEIGLGVSIGAGDENFPNHGAARKSGNGNGRSGDAAELGERRGWGRRALAVRG